MAVAGARQFEGDAGPINADESTRKNRERCASIWSDPRRPALAADPQCANEHPRL